MDATHLHSPSPQALARSLTWQGYEFLELARNLDRWNRAQQIFTRIGSASLEICKQVLTDLARQALGLD